MKLKELQGQKQVLLKYQRSREQLLGNLD